MQDDKRTRVDETLAPTRNFSISTADRIRAAAGPHAYMRRRRHIEDLTASLRETAAAALHGARGDVGDVDVTEARRELEGRPAVVKALRELNHLITAHNRYYPIEANLPLDPSARVQLDRGRPWQPLPTMTLCDVLEDVRFACGASSPVGKIR